jgi:hypothetical protein
VVRPSNATGDGSGGTMFYFKASAYPNISGGGTLNLTQFNTSVVTCPGGPAPDPPLPNLIPSVAGSQPQPQILLAPCTGTYGDPSGQYRGMLFFQDHTANGTKPNLSGGSGLVLVGDMYFHASNWSSLLTLSGSSASTSFSYGSIVTDQLNLTGGGTINMVLSPSQLATVSKVSLLR